MSEQHFCLGCGEHHSPADCSLNPSKFPPPPEIVLSERIAAAVIDAVEWMIDEGQYFNDEAAGNELMRYLLANHPDKMQQWIREAVAERCSQPPSTT